MSTGPYPNACAATRKVLLCAIVLLVFNPKLDLVKAGFTLLVQLATVQRASPAVPFICPSFRPGLRCFGSVCWSGFSVEMPCNVWPLCGSPGNKILGCCCE